MLVELLHPQVVEDAGVRPELPIVTVMSIFLNTDWCRHDAQGDSFRIQNGQVVSGAWEIADEMTFWRDVNTWLKCCQLPDELEAEFWQIANGKVAYA